MKPHLWIGLFSSAVLILGLTLAHRSFQSSDAASIPFVPAIDNSNLFTDHTPLAVTITAAGRRAPWRTTIDEITSSPSMWRRMHLADWNVVPEPLRDEGLDRMLTQYARLLNNPPAWDQMSVADWDAVPQPIRTIAYRRMVAYWAGFYDVGLPHGLPPAVVAEMLAAMVTSESWFDRRASVRGALDEAGSENRGGLEG